MTPLTVEERLDRLAMELKETRAEVRRLQAARRSQRSLAFPAAGQIPTSPSATVTRLKTPLLVQNEAGNTILEVDGTQGRWGVTVYGPGGPTTKIGTNSDGAGSLRLMKAGQADPKTGFASLKDVVDLGTTGVRLYGKNGSKPLAAMTVDGDDKGRIAVYSQSGDGLAWLEEDADRGGALSIADAQGNGVFRAEYTVAQGGNACVSNKKRGVQCLGIGLPLQIR